MDADRPVADEELEGLFAFLRGRRLALAVSGGPDSMALMELVARWIAREPRAPEAQGAPPVVVLTVDHGLRPEAAAEAEQVAARAAQLGLPHHTLRWLAPRPKSGVQAAARSARLKLFDAWLAGDAERRGAASGGGRRALVLAHTEDDQAETLLMRLARGSGIDGLSAMRSVERLVVAPADGTLPGAIDVLRPLLSVPKARLLATLRAAGIGWCEDPSNESEAFERVRLRRQRSTLLRLGLAPPALALTARRAARAQAALAQHARSVRARAVTLRYGVSATLALAPITALAGGAEDTLVRVVADLLADLGGQPEPPRLQRLEALCERLLAHATAGRRFTGATLGGCLIESAGEAAPWPVRLTREAGRKGLPRMVLAPGRQAIWDRRFLVGLDRSARQPVEVAALGAARWAALKAHHGALVDSGLPASAAASLPAFFEAQTLVAVPSLHDLVPELAGPEAVATEAAPGARPPICTAEFRPATSW